MTKKEILNIVKVNFDNIFIEHSDSSRRIKFFQNLNENLDILFDESDLSKDQLKVSYFDQEIPGENWGVHASHCCATHGCKYGMNKCPVETGKIKQEYPCESCQS